MKLIIEKIALFVCVLVLAQSVHADEYFGKFLDRLRGEFIADSEPRPQFKIDQDFRFEDPNGLLWVTPSGTKVDGASIPQFFWSIIGGPFEGQYINASVIHDHYCRTKERTAHDTHRNFYYGMMASGVPEWKADLMHWAVSAFGPSWKLERRVVMSQECITTGKNLKTCNSVPTVELITVSEPPVDLTNPEVLALAISKTNSVARTLLTSKGEVLDVSSSGQINATLTSIEANAASYRKLFQSGNVVNETDRLGLLSQAEKSSLVSIQPWENNMIPNYTQVEILSPNFNEVETKDLPFKLDSGSRAVILDNVDLKAIESNTNVQIKFQQ
ncbi:hypothetical protein V12G01_16672 [Vibrio alginolyticus 12G01]|uniref:DUF1353 domain-containing protein n=1 Tax=Vibrio harveyi group TaxID=717610 RepID=UPI0000D54529|nr:MULTISPECIES: DUF1353 domain-containing protein [Vibrio harveyi group]EAS76899.1 hypothetical protein V12G01_16672 [Vibrio alginolyticus 12G01]MCR9525446.1 DUF1353 domain-containing protein [Vibrio alginolyticus]MCR9546318.1 DUF1353 domain-containing protein [Vibrio antiquarius]ULF83669.1 DUF1353 domain-containing protein [Vibrio alginolyticus]